MNQLKVKNPQMYQMLNQRKDNPMELLKETIKNFNPQQLQGFFQQAQMMGFPQDVLNEIQNQLK